MNHIDDYDEKTVPEVRERLGDLSVDAIGAVADYEERNKDRVTLLDAIDRELADRDSDANGDRQARPSEAPDRPGSVSRSTTDSPSDDAEAPAAGSRVTERETASTGDPHRTVRVHAPGRGYYGGLWFDDRGTRTVPLTPRVEQALQTTELEPATE